MKKILTLLFLIVSLTVQAQFGGYLKFQGGHFYMWYTPTGWINCDTMILRLMGIHDTANVIRAEISEAMPIDNIFDWQTNKYAYYSDTTGTGAIGGWYLGTQDPTGIKRINLNGDLHSTKMRTSYLECTSSTSPFSAYTSGSAYSTGISGYNNALNLSRAAASQTGTLTGNILNIQNLTSGSANISGNMINITDNPTTSGNNKGKILSATLGSTERIRLDPRVKSSEDSIAYLFDTDRQLLSTAKHTVFKNYGTEILSIGYDGSLVVKDTTLADYIKHYANLSSDTSRTWTDTLKHDKLNIIYISTTAVDTLKANTIVILKNPGIPGSTEIKQWIGDGSHSPILGAITVVSGSYDSTLGIRNILTFLRLTKNKVLCSIVQEP